MAANNLPKAPKMPVFNMIMKSVSDIKRNYSQIIKDMANSNEPVFVMNHNTPEAVLMTYSLYKKTIVATRDQISELLEVINRLENDALARTAQERLADPNSVWVPLDEVTGSDPDQKNPYVAMSDAELFD